MRPEDIGILAFRGDPDKQPFMVGYFKSSGIRESKVRQKRDARRRKKSESSSLDYRNNPYTGKSVNFVNLTHRNEGDSFFTLSTGAISRRERREYIYICRIRVRVTSKINFIRSFSDFCFDHSKLND